MPASDPALVRGGRAGTGSDPATAFQCDVWVADIGLERPAYRSLLDPVEHTRRVAYRYDADKARFTIGAVLLRLALAQETGIAPAAVRVDRSCQRCGAPHGKPIARDADAHVSVSHSGDKVLVALTRAAPVGVDVEKVTEADTRGLSGLVLAPGELVRRHEDFFTYWSRKESAVKATGDGLAMPLDRVVVSGVDEPARLISYGGKALAASMRDLPVDSGYAAAVTVLAGGDLEVVSHDGAELLTARFPVERTDG